MSAPELSGVKSIAKESRMKFLDQGLERLLRPVQVKLFLLVLAAQIGAFLFGSVYPLQGAQAEQIVTQYHQQTNSIYALNPFSMWVEIVSNNAHIAAFELFPFLGALVNGIAMFNTGQVLHASALAYGYPFPALSGLGLSLELFLFPHTLVEFSAYALATSASIIFLSTLIRWWKVSKIDVKGQGVYFASKKEAKVFQTATNDGNQLPTWTVNGLVFGGTVGQTTPPSFSTKYQNTGETLRTFARAIAGVLILLAIAGAIETITIDVGLIAVLGWFPVSFGIYYLRKWSKVHQPKTINTA
jgi:uncharacterized membrane protein SpoIIM required for sporulation